MLQPKRTKFRKQQTGRNRGLALRGSKVSFGEYALKATERGRLTARQIEAARRTMTRHVKSTGSVRFSQDVYFMKWKVLMKALRAKPLRLPRRSYLLKQRLLNGR